MAGGAKDMTKQFGEGDLVQVRLAFPPGHIRTPFYARGKQGVVDSFVGEFANPEELAFGRTGGPKLPLYRVRFEQQELWPDYNGGARDSTMIDLYEHWLERPEPTP
jgi:nitrile hydratase subunit beta